MFSGCFPEILKQEEKENLMFLKIVWPFKNWTQYTSRKVKDKTHKYYKCPKCKAVLRVPKDAAKFRLPAQNANMSLSKENLRRLIYESYLKKSAYFKACSDELLEHHLVQSMSRYEQHGTTNRLDHSVQVAQYSYWVSKN